MTVNPLVAGRLDGPKDAWAGVWIAEDIELIRQGVKSGSWIDTSLGVVGAGLDALAIVSDPVGALLQYGVAWIIEHVKPLTEALDWLAGDPGQIAGHAQTWHNVAASLHQTAADAQRAVRWDVADWGGTAGQAYRAWAKQQQDAIAGLGKAAEAMAVITEGAGMLIAAVRVLVRDAIATCVSRLISYAIEEAATLGFATPLVIEQVSTLVASWAAKISRWLRALLASLRRLMPAIRRIGELTEELKNSLNRLRGSRPAADTGAHPGAYGGGDLDPMGRRSDWTDPSAHPQPPSRPPDAHLPAGDPVYHRPGGTAIGYDRATMRNFDAVAPEPGYHDVVVHGEPDGLFRPGLVGADGKNYPANFTHPAQIADAVRHNPHYDGGPVRLVSCHTGAVDPLAGVSPAAQQVADALGVPVMAPTNAVGVDRYGPVGQTPVIRDGGQWKIYYPNGGR